MIHKAIIEGIREPNDALERLQLDLGAVRLSMILLLFFPVSLAPSELETDDEC